MDKKEEQPQKFVTSNKPYFDTDLDSWNEDWFPMTWVLLDKLKNENVKLFLDFTYGYLILIINDEISEYGRNVVVSKCKKYLGIGPICGFEMGKLFIQGE